MQEYILREIQVDLRCNLSLIPCRKSRPVFERSEERTKPLTNSISYLLRVLDLIANSSADKVHNELNSSPTALNSSILGWNMQLL